MNRKQAVIIVTLLVLIVCAGVLAAKVNSPLYVSDTNFNDSISNSASTDTSSSSTANKTTVKSDYISEARLTRDKNTAQTIESLKDIIDDKNSSQTYRDTASQQSITITTAKNNDTTVETMLKGKGYKDALCTIINDKVTVVVKCDSEKLSDKQLREIKDVVLSVTKLRNIEIAAPVH